ncbi:iron ABC transporter permease [Halorubellus sp. PRR65]|uniref:ABC transporter permease n=1 Tax=Halorubellus sp. PRR65 TaxID=3098148 RepID=UPI002B25DB79|nr:iron ABC transporter permease [Halorubellus sp. PRR65]
MSQSTPDSPSRAFVQRFVDEHALAVGVGGTAVVLLLVLYVPVGVVFSEAFGVDGTPSLARFADVFTDGFYVGALAGVLDSPFAFGEHAAAVAGFVGGFGVRVATLGPVPYPAPVLPSVDTGLFGFTAWQALLSTVASVLIGLPAAYVLATFEFRGRRTLRSITILPFVLPGILVAAGFFAAFGESGLLNDVLSVVGLHQSLLETSPLFVVILAHAFYNAPLIARVTTGAWESVDARMVETARSLGAPRRRAFRDVVVPQLLPAVLAGALLTYVFTFMTFPIVLALGGLQLATVEVWVYNAAQNLDVPTAATLAVVETAISLALTYAYLRYESGRSGLGSAGVDVDRERFLPDLGALDAKRVAVLAYGAFAAVLFLAPIAALLVESFTDGAGFTLDNYAFLVQRQTTGAAFQTKPLDAIANSLLFATATLLVAVPMGVVVAVVSSGRGRTRTVVDALTMLPVAVSGIVFGVGLLTGLVFGIDLPGPYRLQVTGVVAVVAAHAVAAYPFVVRNVKPQLAAVDRALVESARALGATRVRALLDVQLPLVWPGVLAGAAFAFAISMGEFDSTVILATQSSTATMPVAVERYLGRTLGPAMAMGSVLLVVTAASFVAVDRLGGYIGGIQR